VREVLQLLAVGKASKEIAAALHLSAKTVESHRAQIMDKLGLRTVAELTKFAIREGLTSLEG
jgi:DNA-binding NarL/FixJ family response regulator